MNLKRLLQWTVTLFFLCFATLGCDQGEIATFSGQKYNLTSPVVCTPGGDHAYCSWMGVCNADGTGCICNDPEHWWSSERCATWHPNPEVLPDTEVPTDTEDTGDTGDGTDTASENAILNVKLQPGSAPVLPEHLNTWVLRFEPLFSLSETELAEIREQGDNDELTDLTRWYRVELKSDTDVPLFAAQVRALDNVAFVEIAPDLVEPPAVTPDFEPNQDYLNAATDGLNARYAWTFPGGNGAGITIHDVEYGWNQTHEDLTTAAGVPLLMNPGDTIWAAPDAYVHHGTAVLGELIANNDGIGVTGIAWGADIALAPEYTNVAGHNRANAIMLAVANGDPGDVILLEMQTSACGAGYGPAEWEQAVFDAVETAVANGFVVVAAAGNGAVDLDSAGCNNNFDRTVRDSGAIIVGSSEPPGPSDRERRASSSYGDRVDVQGYGTGIQTTGYGTSYQDPDDMNNQDRWYRSDFGGTSGASAMVAGAVADLQGIFLERFGTPMTPFQMRSILKETGSPQMGDLTEHVGPRPDLQAAIDSLMQGPIDIVFLVDVTGSYADDLPNFKAQAPGIMSTLLSENPDTRFGLATFQDFPVAPFGEAGDEAYTMRQDLTTSTADVEAAINSLIAGGGADGPESQLTALYQLATGAGQTVGAYQIPAGQQANFRDGATKLILLWTDAAFHLPGDAGTIAYPGNSFNETSSAILALDPPQVLGISAGTDAFADLNQIAAETNSLAPETGVDCNNDGIIDIAAGDPLVCLASTTGVDIGEVVLALVDAGIRNRNFDLGIELSFTGEIPEFMRIGESIEIGVSGVATNHGPSGPADGEIELTATGSSSIAVTPISSSHPATNLLVNTPQTHDLVYTVTCNQAGQSNITINSSISLVHPIDAFDAVPVNNTDRISASINCLAPVHATQMLDLRNRVSVYAPHVYGGNDMRLGTDGVIHGDVTVNGNVSLWSNSVIDGDLNMAGELVQQTGVTVVGTLNQNYNGENVLLPTKSVPTGNMSVTIANDDSGSWIPGTYADGMVRARGSLTLSAGIYNFRTLQLEPDTELILDTSNGPIEVNVAGQLAIGDRVRTVGGTPTSVTFYSGSSDMVRFGTNLNFSSALIVPAGEVHVYSNALIAAHVWARKIVVEPDTIAQ